MNALHAAQTLDICDVNEIHSHVTFKKSQYCHFRVLFYIFDSDYIKT